MSRTTQAARKAALPLLFSTILGAGAMTASAAEPLLVITVESPEASLERLDHAMRACAPEEAKDELPEQTLLEGLRSDMETSGFDALDLSGRMELVVFSPNDIPSWPLALRVATDDAEALAAEIANDPSFTTQAVEGGLVVGVNPEAVKEAARASGASSAIGDAPEGGLRMNLDFAAAFDQFAPMIRGFVPMIEQQVDQASSLKHDSGMGLGKVLRLEIEAYLALLGQIERVGWSMELGEDGASFAKHVSARPGTTLAEVFEWNPEGAPTAYKALNGDGAAVISLRLPLRDLMGPTWDYLEGIFKEVAGPDAIDPAMGEKLKEMMAVWGDEIAYDYLVPTDDPTIGMAIVSLPPDTDAAMAMIREMPEFWEQSGFRDIYGSFGLAMEFEVEQGALETGGTTFDRMNIKFDASGLDPEAAAAISAMFGLQPYLCGVAGEGFAMTLGIDPGPIAERLNGSEDATEGAALAAVERHGEEGWLHADIHFDRAAVRTLEMIQALSGGDDDIEGLLEIYREGGASEPMTMRAHNAGGVAIGEAFVPYSAIREGIAPFYLFNASMEEEATYKTAVAASAPARADGIGTPEGTFLYDEETGEYVNPETGEIYDGGEDMDYGDEDMDYEEDYGDE